MNLFDILSDDERIIVLSSKQDGIIVTWNQSCTLQYWNKKTVEQYGSSYPFNKDELDIWEETDCRTLMNEPANFAEARIAAQEWLAGNSG